MLFCSSHVPLFRGIPIVLPVFGCTFRRCSMFRSSVLRCSWFYSIPFFCIEFRRKKKLVAYSNIWHNLNGKIILNDDLCNYSKKNDPSPSLKNPNPSTITTTLFIIHWIPPLREANEIDPSKMWVLSMIEQIFLEKAIKYWREIFLFEMLLCIQLQTYKFVMEQWQFVLSSKIFEKPETVGLQES